LLGCRGFDQFQKSAQKKVTLFMTRGRVQQVCEQCRMGRYLTILMPEDSEYVEIGRTQTALFALSCQDRDCLRKDLLEGLETRPGEVRICAQDVKEFSRNVHLDLPFTYN
jgi:hypothetical protein